MSKMKFDPGCVFVTSGIHEANLDVSGYFFRHCGGDWGDVDQSDCLLNEMAAIERPLKGRIFSIYRVADRTIFVITERDHDAQENRTVIMWASEY